MYPTTYGYVRHSGYSNDAATKMNGIASTVEDPGGVVILLRSIDSQAMWRPLAPGPHGKRC